MGSSSKSSNKTESNAYNFNNVDYGNGGSGGGLAKNLNAVDSEITTGDIRVTQTDHGATKQAGYTSRKAIDMAGNAVGAMERLGGEAITGAYGDAADSRDFAEGIFARSTDRAYDDVAASRAATFEAFNEAGEWVVDSNKTGLQFATQNMDRALAFAKQATRSEAGQTVETMSKMLLLTAGGLGALFLLARK